MWGIEEVGVGVGVVDYGSGSGGGRIEEVGALKKSNMIFYVSLIWK